ncbi:glycosyltransferase [Variovorax sp. J31P207]|uniref:glycosyltransferase n=1 Tax=Variovorax sp. J31P207 TaxID=3053510 RepID=UPI002575B576|nr:glycosyltransferase [Variovorax sp. J31P207]MDM0067675.1 glycosyltransferase [Variovorax sp. J31P207]
MKSNDAHGGAVLNAPVDVRSYDVFADLSGLAPDQKLVAHHVTQLVRVCGFDLASSRISAVLPGGVNIGSEFAQWVSDGEPVPAFLRAVERAASARRPLLVVFGAVLPRNEVMPPLLEALQVDPLFGSAQPRFANALTDGICPLPARSGRVVMEAWSSRAALSRLPAVTVTAELAAGCLLLRREVIAAWEASEEVVSVVGALALGLVRARRRGFRNAVVNHTVVALPPVGSPSQHPSTSTPMHDLAAAYPSIPADDATCLIALYPDHARADEENDREPQRRLESLLTAAHPANGAPRRLLVDCRGLAPWHNGTSECILGLLDGMSGLKTPWAIYVQSDAEAAEFHRLSQRYPTFEHQHGPLSGRFAAALVPNQPWALFRVAELHHHALVLVFNMLDTIAWDILYPAEAGLQAVWRFVARHSDGLSYISGFTRDRFRQRFPVEGGVKERVVHLSFAEEDHVLPACRDLPPADHVLLFGNAYDHKDVERTLAILLDAFPLQQVVVLGGRESSSPRVKVIPSGKVSHEEVHRLIATARAVVFPSFYEGFGLPVVEALAYGRPVLVRASALWSEIAAHSRLAGRMVAFDDTVSLVEALGRVLAELPVDTIPSATALRDGESPVSWRSCAAESLAVVDACLSQAEVSRWMAREEALQLAGLSAERT